MQLNAIQPDGTLEQPVADLPPEAVQACQATAAMYAAAVFQPPWIGYLAFDEGRCVGACAFKSPPRDGRVEIAYYTFPAYEGCGEATWMARALVDIAAAADPRVTIVAQTLPQAGPSTRVLEKCGFEKSGERDDPQDGRIWEWTRGHNGAWAA